MTRGAYLTPEALSGAVVCRPLLIPVELLSAFNGALEELTKSYNWQELGAMTPVEAADAAREIIDRYYIDNCEAFSMSELSIDKSIEWFSWVVQTGNAIQQTTNTVGNEATVNWFQSAAAINDKLRYTLWLDAGLYKITIKAACLSAGGIQHIQIGGTDYALLDWYSPTPINSVYQSGYFPVAAAGNVSIDSLMSTKNAASSSYRLMGERFWIEKVG